MGHDNYGHFVRFIIFANTACAYVLVLLVGRVRAILYAARHFQVISKKKIGFHPPINAPIDISLTLNLI